MKGVAVVLTKWDLKLSFTQRVRRLISRLWQWLKKHVGRKKVDAIPFWEIAGEEINLAGILETIEEQKE